jgi:putative methyltransferase (TIGR04325 family)
MNVSAISLEACKRHIKALPMYRHWRQNRELRRFVEHDEMHLHFGVFRDFAHARAWLPRSNEFDDEALVDDYLNVRTQRIFAYDYPVLHWLHRAIDEGARRVTDIGGSVGVHYIAYHRYLDYPASLRWQVIEVPSMVRLGRALADKSGLGSLTFSDTLEAGDTPADVWLAEGSIHYVEHAQPDALLARARFRPRYLVLNKLPLHDGEGFVSTQNLGGGLFAPHHVYNRQRFIDGIEAAGYSLIDRWDVPERSFYLPGHPDKSFGWYSGLCFKVQEDGPGNASASG